MTADESLAAIRPKVDRAKHHIRDLNGQVSAFLDAKPYKVGVKRDPKIRKPVYYVVSVSEIPSGIAATTGDAIQNLRSARPSRLQAREHRLWWSASPSRAHCISHCG